MTRANANQWFTGAKAANSIIPIARFVAPTVFATKTDGYGCLFSIAGVDEEALTDQELDAVVRSIEGGLRGIPEGACLYQYMRIRSGADIPRRAKYDDPITQTFVESRLAFLAKTARFRRVDIHWCLTLEPKLSNPFSTKPKEQAGENAKLISALQKAATTLVGHFKEKIGIRLLEKEATFQFFSQLFNLEDWAEKATLISDRGVDSQIATSPVSWEAEHLRVGKRYVQMFSLSSTPAASQPCLFNDLMNLDCDATFCTTWKPKSSADVRKEISAQEKWIDFFKVGILQRVMAGKNFAALDQGAGARAASDGVDDLGQVVSDLGKKAQGEYTGRLMLSHRSVEQLRDNMPMVHRLFVDAQANVVEETLGNLSAFYAMFPCNHRYNVFPLWLGEDHHARMSPVFAPHIGHSYSNDLDSEYLNVLETRQGTPFFQDVYVNGVRVMLIIGPPGTGKSTLLKQMLEQIEDRGESAIVYDPAGEFVREFYREDRGDFILNPFDARSPYWTPSSELRNPAEARTIAASLYQPTDNKKGEFFTDTPQKVFAHLMKYRPSPQELVDWMSNEEEIDARVSGTEIAAMIAKNAPDQRNGVLGSLGLIADSLRLLKTKEQAMGREWSATQWAEKREGWIFLTSTEEAQQEALRPLHSLWIDLLVLRLLAEPKEGQTRAWFVLDELATLQRLPQFHTALTKGRKSNNPIIFGYQGKAQLEVIYGHLAEVMLSMPSTKIIMKTSEPNAAKWASELIGDIEIERVRETKADGKRAGKSFTLDRQIEPLVMASEIEGLDDLHAFMKLGNCVTRFSFPHMERDLRSPSIVPRNIPEEDMWLRSLPPEAQGPTVVKPSPTPAPTPAAAIGSQPAAEATVEPSAVPGPPLGDRQQTGSELDALIEQGRQALRDRYTAYQKARETAVVPQLVSTPPLAPPPPTPPSTLPLFEQQPSAERARVL